MPRLCDLHVHSNYSDGTCSPNELINLARQQGLSAIALCDHNTIGGLPELLAAAEGSTVLPSRVSNSPPNTPVKSCISSPCSSVPGTMIRSTSC